ncbi:MAG: tetratricopeptide repeat protein [Balneolia bacterium]|nr:tetratricopeptide repeat protein [Balneolia bacterium]
MKEENDINLQAKAQELIHLYLTNQMDEAEKQAFWEFMIENPQFHKELRLNASLLQLSRQNPGLLDASDDDINATSVNGLPPYTDDDSSGAGDSQPEPESSSYTYWVISMAAVIMVVIAFNFIRVSSPTETQLFVAEMPTNLSPVDEIDIFFFESIPTLRDETSEDEFVQKFDQSLIAAFSDDFQTALQIYDELIAAFPEDPRTAMVHMNAGILYYNLSEYPNAVSRFEDAIELSEEDPAMDEKALWFMANAQLNIGEVTQAYANLLTIASMQGEFMFEAGELINQIEPYLE